MNSAACLTYVTCPDRDVAVTIGTAMVQQGLAACANVGAPMTAIYRWQGSLTTDVEVPLVLKTTAARFDALRAAIVAIHPYSVPCVVAIPVVDGHQPYLAWVAAEVQPQPEVS